MWVGFKVAVFDLRNILAVENQIFLENLPGMENLESEAQASFKEDGDGGSAALRTYVNWIIQTSVILGSMLAVAFIIYGGITYMTTDSFSGKTEGREHVTNALGGLIFLIGGYLIFIQINPNILNIDFSTASGRVKIVAQQMQINLSFAESDWSDGSKGSSANDKFIEAGYDGRFCSGNKTSDNVFSDVASYFVFDDIALLNGSANLILNGVTGDDRYNFVDGMKRGENLVTWLTTGEMTPENECILVRNMYKERGYEVQACYPDTQWGALSGCFNYNASTKQDNDIEKWRQRYSNNEFKKWCEELDGVMDGAWDNPDDVKTKVIHKAVGGNMVPYRPGKVGSGLDIEVFDGAGDNAGRSWFSNHVGAHDKMCVAGKRLDDSYATVTSGNGMNIALSCDSDDLERCEEKFNRLKNDNKISKNCSFTYVYSRQNEKVDMAVKKECIKK